MTEELKKQIEREADESSGVFSITSQRRFFRFGYIAGATKYAEEYSLKYDNENYHLRVANKHNAELYAENSQLKARISKLEKELEEVYEAGAPMAANQCLHGIRGDEGGNSYCPEIERLKARIAELHNALKCIMSENVTSTDLHKAEAVLNKLNTNINP